MKDHGINDIDTLVDSTNIMNSHGIMPIVSIQSISDLKSNTESDITFVEAFQEFKNIGKNIGYEQLTADIIYDKNQKYLSDLSPKDKKGIDQKLLNFMLTIGKEFPPGSCGNIHNLYLEDIGRIVAKAKFLYVTAGKLLEGDKNLYNVPPKGEEGMLFGNGVGKIHVWITLDSGEIIDLAHNLNMAHVRQNNDLIKPIIGNPNTIKKKYGYEYVPYKIIGHINNEI